MAPILMRQGHASPQILSLPRGAANPEAYEIAGRFDMSISYSLEPC